MKPRSIYFKFLQTLVWVGALIIGVHHVGFAAAGGPDAYGYTWKDSNEPGGPAYQWIDITTTGTQVTGLGDDNFAGPFGFIDGFPFLSFLCITLFIILRLQHLNWQRNMIGIFFNDLTQFPVI